MRLRCLLLLVATLPIVGFEPEDDTVKKEREKFKGLWYVTSYEVDGKEFDSDKIKRFEYVFDLDKVTVKANSQERVSTFTVNPSAKPKAIELVWKDKVTVGIYEFNGTDRLKICLAREGEKKRPKEFVSKERTDVSLLVLRRAKQ